MSMPLTLLAYEPPFTTVTVKYPGFAGAVLGVDQPAGTFILNVP
jgi:hypothetical protein